MALKFARLARPLIHVLKPNEKITEHGITPEELQADQAHRSTRKDEGGVGRRRRTDERLVPLI